jgi:hypothetical protein
MKLIWAKNWDKPQAHFWCWWWTHLLDFPESHDIARVSRKARQAQLRLLKEHGVNPEHFIIEMTNADVYGDGSVSRVLAVVDTHTVVSAA